MLDGFLTNSSVLASQIADEVPLSKAVFDSFCSVDRKQFLPPRLQSKAYRLDPLLLESYQWISSPVTVAKMTMALSCEGCDSVLEIGTGSGYQAAILSHLVRRVFSVERIERLFLEARANIKNAKIININTKLDDGNAGWKTYAPYERILFSACLSTEPDKILEQLEDGGILVTPVEAGGIQRIMRFTKRAGGIQKETLDECLFVPVLDGVQRS
ncbi:MAG: protein-L-isoaspartate(D-aspartate) O-methyltransferase [Helicobacteraceae bacterium]